MKRGHGFVVLGAIACAYAAACTSSSNGSPTASDDAGASSGGSGAGSGGSGSGSDSGGGSGSGAGSGSGSGGASGSGSGGGGDRTVIASGLSDPVALVVAGGSLFWIEESGKASSAIKTVAASGGTPTTVLAKGGLDGNLGTDGTSLYYSVTDTNSVSEVDKVALDGSNPKTLVGNLTAETTETNSGRSALFVANGNVYVQTSAKIGSVPTGGGSLQSASGAASAPNLYWGDATGLYVGAIDVTADGGPGLDIDVFPLGGGAPVVLRSAPVTSQSAILQTITQSSGSVYLVMQDHAASPQTSSLLKSAPTGGAPATTGTYPNMDIEDVAADAQGIYVTNRTPSSGPGVYSIPLAGGAPTLVQASALTDIEPRTVVLDASHVYWISGGYNTGQASLHAKAR